MNYEYRWIYAGCFVVLIVIAGCFLDLDSLLQDSDALGKAINQFAMTVPMVDKKIQRTAVGDAGAMTDFLRRVREQQLELVSAMSFDNTVYQVRLRGSYDNVRRLLMLMQEQYELQDFSLVESNGLISAELQISEGFRQKSISHKALSALNPFCNTKPQTLMIKNSGTELLGTVMQNGRSSSVLLRADRKIESLASS